MLQRAVRYYLNTKLPSIHGNAHETGLVTRMLPACDTGRYCKQCPFWELYIKRRSAILHALQPWQRATGTSNMLCVQASALLHTGRLLSQIVS